MESDIYLLEYNEKIIGVFSSFHKTDIFLRGCYQSGLMSKTDKINILSFRNDSCLCLSKTVYNFDNTWKLPEDKDVRSVNVTLKPKVKPQPEKPKVDNEDPISMKMAKQKIDIQHKINLLKQQKEKIAESKKVFESDLKLFDIFKTSKKNDINFMIPELFEKKYSLMEKLEQENRLDWENFVNEFQQETFYNEYFGLNDYEKSFLNYDGDLSDENKSEKSSIDEEMDLETESETDTSISSNN